jgi:hypothetical protein
MESDLNDWIRSTRIGFLLTELETGATFAKVGLDSNDEGKRTRNRKNARKAYNAILRFVPDTTLTQTEKQQIDEGLVCLRSLLRRLGETF